MLDATRVPEVLFHALPRHQHVVKTGIGYGQAGEVRDAGQKRQCVPVVARADLLRVKRDEAENVVLGLQGRTHHGAQAQSHDRVAAPEPAVTHGVCAQDCLLLLEHILKNRLAQRQPVIACPAHDPCCCWRKGAALGVTQDNETPVGVGEHAKQGVKDFFQELVFGSAHADRAEHVADQVHALVGGGRLLRRHLPGQYASHHQ